MSGTLKSYYDDLYAKDTMLFGAMPLGIVRVALEEQILWPESSILVIGGGQGRNAFPKKLWRVAVGARRAPTFLRPQKLLTKNRR